MRSLKPLLKGMAVALACAMAVPMTASGQTEDPLVQWEAMYQKMRRGQINGLQWREFEKMMKEKYGIVTDYAGRPRLPERVAAPVEEPQMSIPEELRVQYATCNQLPIAVKATAFLNQLPPNGTWSKVDNTSFLYTATTHDAMEESSSKVKYMFRRGQPSACGVYSPCIILFDVALDGRRLNSSEFQQVCGTIQMNVEMQSMQRR